MIPISKDMIEPILKSNIEYVNSVEEFEKIELDYNETKLAFDNFKQCFYIRSRDKKGEYSRVFVFFYEDFGQRVSSIRKEEFIEKCKKIGYKADKIEIACLLFIDCWSNKAVSDWLWKTKHEMIEYDSMKTKKSRMMQELYPELVKHKSKQKVNKE